jgi:hypothetical protein
MTQRAAMRTRLAVLFSLQMARQQLRDKKEALDTGPFLDSCNRLPPVSLDRPHRLLRLRHHSSDVWTKKRRQINRFVVRLSDS